jgi:hypothetical protein
MRITTKLPRVAVRVTVLLAAIAAAQIAGAETLLWLDSPKPASWNQSGMEIPLAPRPSTAVDARCRESARPPQLEEDGRLRDRGWDLVGSFQGGWQTLVILATADYDGMCRPRKYQGFVFVNGVFAGTLSPHEMDSRTDGALGKISLESPTRLVAEYARYSATDPLCCASGSTSVVFELSRNGPTLRPVSTSGFVKHPDNSTPGRAQGGLFRLPL